MYPYLHGCSIVFNAGDHHKIPASVFALLNREFKKPRRPRQRERRLRKGLMSRTMAVHVRYNSWYISFRPPQNNMK